MHRSLSIESSKCTGCLQCEMACSVRFEHKINPARSRIRVFTFHETGRFIPYTCTQCAGAWCQAACPIEAISANDATGARVVNEKLCVGCKICTIACPFGSINYNADTGKAIKCDLCGGAPVCVDACPTQAITFIDAETTGLSRMRSWAEKSQPEVNAAKY